MQNLIGYKVHPELISRFPHEVQGSSHQGKPRPSCPNGINHNHLSNLRWPSLKRMKWSQGKWVTNSLQDKTLRGKLILHRLHWNYAAVNLVSRLYWTSCLNTEGSMGRGSRLLVPEVSGICYYRSRCRSFVGWYLDLQVNPGGSVSSSQVPWGWGVILSCLPMSIHFLGKASHARRSSETKLKYV